MIPLALAACSGTYEEMLQQLYKNTVPTITTAALDSLMQQKAIVLLDTRAWQEYAVSHIEGARFVGFEDFSLSKLQAVPKDAQIVVYCSVGYRSERIGEQLLQAGYTNVYNVYGGIFQWKNEQFPVYNSQGERTDSIHAYNKMWGRWLHSGRKIY